MTSKERKQQRYERRMKARRKNVKEYPFDLMTNLDNLYQAFLKCRKGVSWKESVQRYGINIFRNILKLQRNLIEQKKIQFGFVEFELHERGKIRHIKSVHISERVVQKCLCDNILTPMLQQSLIYDNSASLKGKGTHFALNRLKCHLRRFYREHGCKGYALKIDFKKYFDSIDHELLLYLLRKKIKDDKVFNLVKGFITVFGDVKSLGLGSQISQICAIYFPNKLDHTIKALKVKYYGRYMDDLYLFDVDKVHLKELLVEIKVICKGLKITINDSKTHITTLTHGVDFLKGRYSLSPTGKIICHAHRDSLVRMLRRLKAFAKLAAQGRMTLRDVYDAYACWRGSFLKRFKGEFHRIARLDVVYNKLFIREINLVGGS